MVGYMLEILREREEVRALEKFHDNYEAVTKINRELNADFE